MFRFDYTGCQGNDNNFESLLDCQKTCENVIRTHVYIFLEFFMFFIAFNLSAEPQCSQGDAYKDYQGNYYVCSNSGTGNSCPVNYECNFDGYVWGCCPTKGEECLICFILKLYKSIFIDLFETIY